MSLFRSSWGTVELWLGSIETEDGRKIVVQEYTQGDQANVQNRGSVPKTCRVQLLFDDMTGAKEEGKERLLSLIALKELGKPQIFVHPLYGRYLAEIGDFTHTISGDNTITASASFTPTETIGAVVVDPIGVSIEVDERALDAAIDELKTQQADVGIDDSIVPDMATTASGVFADAASARDVLVGISNTTEAITDEIDAKILEAEIETWPVMKAYVMLADAVRNAGDAAMGDVGNLITLRVDSPISLRRLVAELYGGDEADDRAVEAQQLNDISTPGRIPSGTKLRLRQPKKAA